MKILHVIPSIAPRYGGPSNAVYTMCRALHANGLEILIASTNADGEGVLPLPLGEQMHYQGVPTILFSRQWNEGIKYSRPLASWLHQNVRNYDMVHIHAVFSHACVSAANSCIRYKIPYIVRPLGTLDPWSLKQKKYRKRIYMTLGVKRMLTNASAIHYTADEEMRLAETELGISRGIVIPNGIELNSEDYPHPGSQASSQESLRPYILALSRIHPKKGFELLIEAFASLKRRGLFPAWRLVIAGDGEPEYVDRLKTLANQRGLNGDAQFVGWLSGDRKSEALKDAALLAMPSYQENFGISLIEAMAYGVPVLVSPQVNLSPEIEKAGAGWVAELDQENLASAIAEALSDQQERVRRGIIGRELVGQYNSTEVAKTLISTYQRLAQNPSREC